MNLSVPFGNSPEIGRVCPYKIGGPADVEEAWNMYCYDAPFLPEPQTQALIAHPDNLMFTMAGAG